MAIQRDFLQSMYEDTGDFGGDVFAQNEALANIIAPPAPVVTPAPVAPAPAPVAPAPAPVIATPTQPVAPTTPPVAKPAGPSQDIINALSQQILGSSDTSRWTGVGFGSAQANAADMAKILANAGLTDVRQLGVKQVVVPAQYFESGEIPEHTVNAYYNKETGQDLGNLGGTYAERQTGNFFGGTFEGKGNTGYGVQFRPDGTPVFYTQGASSNDVAKIMADLGPIGQIAAAYFGGPAAVAAIAVASGKDPIDIIKSTALAYLGNAAGSAVSGMEGITDVLGKTGTDIVSNAAKQYVGSGGKADIGEALLGGVVNTGINTASSAIGSELGLDKLSPVEQRMLNTGITNIIKGQPIEQALTNAVIAGVTTKPDSNLKTSLGPGDQQEFLDSLIPGYFQPGGAGYIPPEETDPVTVQQPSGLDDFLKQLEQYKQAAVTPDDITRIISGQNFATPEDVQTAINSIDIPKGVSEQDVQSIVSQAFADNPGIKLEDVQSVVDQAVSRIPAGLTEDDLAKSLGMTKQEMLNQLGTTEEGLQQRISGLESEFGGQLSESTKGIESKLDTQSAQFETLLQQYRDLGMDESEALRQTIDDLGADVSGQFKDVSGQISQQGEQFQTLLQQYRDLGMDENAALRQTIDDLGTNVGSQISQQGEQFETLLQQYRDLGMDENEALRQTIDDLGADVSGQFGDLESKLAETQTGVDELAQSLGKTRDELLAEFGVTEDEINQRIADLETEFGGNFSDIEGSLEKTREDLLAEFGLTEEEMAQRIADLETEFGGQLTSGLGKQSAETAALFKNLTAAQQAQAKSQAAQNTALTNALNQVQSTSNFNTLMSLLGSQQQAPVQQAPMQDPYADIKLMEDLFGSEIDLTPAGENTAKRK